jgi:hypothetical protein
LSSWKGDGIDVQPGDAVRIESDECEAGAMVQPPVRVARFVQRVARLRPGKYVLTLTLTEDRAFWTIQEMGRVEG